MRIKNTMNYDQNGCQQFFFITTLFSDTCRYTKNKSWQRCRLYGVIKNESVGNNEIWQI
jgi:hypothetical protein